MGGTLRAIETGFIQSEIQNAAFEYQKAVERADMSVGVNRFRMDEDRKIPVFRLDPAIEKGQIERLRQIRSTRDAKTTQDCLQSSKKRHEVRRTSCR